MPQCKGVGQLYALPKEVGYQEDGAQCDAATTEHLQQVHWSPALSFIGCCYKLLVSVLSAFEMA